MATASLLISVGTIAAIWALFALGLNVKFGYTGLLDFGHVAFFLVGAYTTSLLVAPPAETQDFQTYILGWDIPAKLTGVTGLELVGGLGWFVALLVGTVVAGIFGLLVALPAIRLREDYLAIALLGISVIVKRTVQTEGWLANGPDAFRGFPRPFGGLFPIPGFSVEGTALFAAIVFVFWTIAVALLAREDTIQAGFGADDSRVTLLNAVFAVLTLGFGYAAARRAGARRRETGRTPVVPLLGAGLVAAAIGAGLAAFALFVPAMLLSLGTLSVFVWIYAGVVTVRHFDHVTQREWLVGLGMAVGLIVVFLPGQLRIDLLGTRGLLLTLVALAVYIYAASRLLRNWAQYGDGTSRLTLLGVTGVWLFTFRFFMLASLRELAAGNPTIASGVFVEDILFLVKYQGSTPFDGLVFGYSRFLFALSIAFLVLGYYLSETAVRSPFGRVLKAVREDEDVAMSLGKNPFAYKVQSMVLGSAMAGLAGGLIAVYFGTLTFRNFEPLFTFFMFLIVVIGGTANNKGVILGAALYWAFVRGTQDVAGALPTGSSAIFAIRVALLGAIFIAILYYRPQGIWGERTVVGEGGEQ
jgi:ABC-type branched-subunit amino acid transport system permease subunit